MSQPRVHKGGVIHQAVATGTALGFLVPVVAGVAAIDKLGEGGFTVVASYGGMVGASLGAAVGLLLGVIVRLALICDGWRRNAFGRGAT